MRTRTTDANSCFERNRLDAAYYLAPGVAVRDALSKLAATGSVEMVSLGGSGGLANVWQPSRFKRMYAAPGEPAVPYLRPFDVFEHLPLAASELSAVRSEGLQNYRLTPGLILQSCSGRNLGPLAVVDSYLSDYVLSHDMIRLDIADADCRAYVVAFLSSSAGQALLRQGISGSVVSHLTISDVEQIRVPLPDQETQRKISALQVEALEHFSAARATLAALVTIVDAKFPVPERAQLPKHGWTLSARSLMAGTRLDPHFNDPIVRAAADAANAAGGCRVGDMASAFLPSRYTRYYVEPDYGRPIMSGRQLLQIDPIALRHISARSFASIDEMALGEGTVAFGAVGRWEGRLGQPVLVTRDRGDWLASNDVMRLRARSGVIPGSLWLAVCAETTQVQIAAMPYGSVIDHTGPDDIENRVWLPPVDDDLGKQAEAAWDRFRRGRVRQAEAIDLVDAVVRAGL